MTTPAQRDGWVRVFGESRWHFFGVDGRSLCGKVFIFTVPQDADHYHEHPANCCACLVGLSRKDN